MTALWAVRAGLTERRRGVILISDKSMENRREAMKGSGDWSPVRGFVGTEARRRQWRMKAGGTSGNGKERLRDYSVSRPEIPQRILNREAIQEKVVRKRSVT